MGRGRKRGRDPTEEEAVGVEGGEEGGVFGEMGDREGRVEEGGSSGGAGGGDVRRHPRCDGGARNRNKRKQPRSRREFDRV